MSVAFRRESDEEHLEPKFERPIAPGPNLVTRRGLAQIDAEVARLEQAIAQADAAMADMLRRELRYWHTRHSTAVIAPEPMEGEAGIGSVVRVRLDGDERSIAIVGGDEADPANDRLAFSAPLARALMGAIEGDHLDFAGRTGAIEVLEVEQG